jgi:hypothetical protein
VDVYDESLVDWSAVWLAIAREQLAASRDARTLYALNESRALDAEFHGGLVAVAAAAFAVEAKQLRVLGPSLAPRAHPPPRAWPVNAGDYVGQLLLEQGSIDAHTAEALGRLFALRQTSVHPTPRSERLAAHPVGTDTTRELVAYNADVTEQLVNVAATVVAAIST